MTRNGLQNVFFGGVEVDAAQLRKSLRIGDYRLRFEPKTHRMTLTGRGGREILCVECAHESAIKFARDFGFRDDGSPTREEWSITVPEPTLWSDGSADAERISAALKESGFPYKIRTGEQELKFSMGTGQYTVRSGWTIERMLELLAENVLVSAATIALFQEE